MMAKGAIDGFSGPTEALLLSPAPNYKEISKGSVLGIL